MKNELQIVQSITYNSPGKYYLLNWEKKTITQNLENLVLLFLFGKML